MEHELRRNGRLGRNLLLTARESGEYILTTKINRGEFTEERPPQKVWRMVTIVYGSSTMNTEFVSKRLQGEFGDDEAKLLDVREADTEDLENAENLIFATSSWGSGSLQDDWELFFPMLDGVDLGGKRVALLGLGDQENYPDSFCDALKHLADKVRERGGRLVGETSTAGYSFSRSRAQEEEGTFVGLIIDEDNQADKTDERLHSWAIRLKKLFRK